LQAGRGRISLHLYVSADLSLTDLARAGPSAYAVCVTTATEKLSSAGPPAARPAFDRFSRSWTIALISADVVAFFLSAWAAVTLVSLTIHIDVDDARVALSTVLYVALWLWLFKRLGLYERSFAMTIQDEIYATIAAMVLGIAPQLILFTIVPSISSSRLVLVLSLAISIVAVTATRAVIHRARQVDSLVRQRRVALVGDPSRIDAAREDLADVPNTHVLSIPVSDFDLVMAMQDTSVPSAFELMPWFMKALRWECDTVIFADVPDPRHIPGLLAAARKWGLQVAFVTPRIRAQAYRFAIDILGNQALIVPRPVRATSSATRFVKRALDVAASGACVIVTLPLLAVCALLLASSRSPVLTREARIGRDGQVFEQFGFALPIPLLRDLPRLFNVLRGDMSIVGPRSHDIDTAEAIRAYNPRYAERTLMAPGLIGWAQVHLPDANEERELAYDLFYVENWGLFLDVYVAVKATVGAAASISAKLKKAA
jgi:lipopolysaccharide/colanic/teichoic acid biosynthesis glycosyltransferase